jgi:FkbM family methyltransferase
LVVQLPTKAGGSRAEGDACPGAVTTAAVADATGNATMRLAAKLRNLLLRTHVVAGGDGAGLKLYAPRADPNFARGTYEKPVQDAVVANLFPGDVFYDIGCNIGFFSLIAARCVGPPGRVYAFEPVPSNAAATIRSARLNGMNSIIEVFANAVGGKAGRAELLLTRHIGGATLTSAGTPHDVSGQIDVDVVTVDQVIARRGLRPPSLVKIDVEGAEIGVVEGMRATLRAHRPRIIYELDDATMEGLRRKRSAMAALMKEAGYSLTSLPASYPHSAWRVEHILAQPDPD